MFGDIGNGVSWFVDDMWRLRYVGRYSVLQVSFGTYADCIRHGIYSSSKDGGMSDSAFYGCIIALCLVMTGHPVLAIILFILVA